MVDEAVLFVFSNGYSIQVGDEHARPVPNSEKNLQPQLHLPRRILLGRNDSKSRRVYDRAGRCE